jgi:hypothetical protein
MRQEKKDIRVSWIIENLDNGVTWLEKDNMGFGSIQKLYGINEVQVEAIRKHPKLVGLEPRVTIINLIDDTNTDDGAITTKEEMKLKQIPQFQKEDATEITIDSSLDFATAFNNL